MLEKACVYAMAYALQLRCMCACCGGAVVVAGVLN